MEAHGGSGSITLLVLNLGMPMVSGHPHSLVPGTDLVDHWT